MHSLLKATSASAVFAAALAFCPLSLKAQEATPNDAGTPGSASDPRSNDEPMPTDETNADAAATGEAAPDDSMSADEGSAAEGATTERTQTERTAEEEPPDPEGLATDSADDVSEGESNRDRLAATLAASEEAAVAVREAAQRLPAMLDRIDALVTEVEGLPLEELVTELTSLATSANTLVSSDATQTLPADLSTALAEVEALVRDFREGGIMENANLTLQSTRAAADTLPSLAERAGVLVDQAGVAIEGFQRSGSVLREAERAIREVADAADAVARLARTIERDPNALIFGR